METKNKRLCVFVCQVNKVWIVMVGFLLINSILKRSSLTFFFTISCVYTMHHDYIYPSSPSLLASFINLIQDRVI